jgi:hypothetical protein
VELTCGALFALVVGAAGLVAAPSYAAEPQSTEEAAPAPARASPAVVPPEVGQPPVLPPAAPAAPSPPAPASRPRIVFTIPAIVIGGLAVVSLGAGAVLGGLATSDHSQFLKNPTTETANRGEARALDADMCFGVAATLALTSAVMLLTHPAEAAPQTAGAGAKPLSMAPLLGPHAAGAAAVVRF